MMNRLYQLLENMGYLHPLHPAVTHIPVGLIFGALLLGLASLLFRHEETARAARYCAITALIFVFPTALLGYMDWQHYYAGGWLHPIKIKIVLAIVLFLLLCVSVIFGRKKGTVSWPVASAYVLSVFTVVGLGYFGGQLIYTDKSPPAAPQFESGARLYRVNCSGCHPYGGNIVDPTAPVARSTELIDLETFLRWIRDPRLDNGAKGVMPDFLASKISDAQAKELWLYIVDATGSDGKPRD
ncbi:MAG TPA: DUF2231 domain-containing protein [Syntrophorhabdaceae bacterium]|jgi:uncharacterized membrane protein